MIESVYSINYINYVVVVVTGQHTPHSTLQSPGSRGWPWLAGPHARRTISHVITGPALGWHWLPSDWRYL